MVDRSDSDLLAVYFRLLTSHSDLKHAQKIASLILVEELHSKVGAEGPTHLEALNCAMVIAYARPFARGNARRGGDSRPLPGRFVAHYSRKERELHNTLIEERDKYFAHSDVRARDFRPEVCRVGEATLVSPWSRDTRAPLTASVTELVRQMCEATGERVLAERMRIEPSVSKCFPEVELQSFKASS
jgi:hypothetical protein